jgi:PAP2 superfamily
MSDQSAGESARARRLPSFSLKALTEGQAAYVCIAALFIAAGTLLLPNPGLLTTPVISQFFLFNILALIYAVTAHILAQSAATGSLGKGVDHAFKVILSPDNLARAVPTIMLIALFTFTFASFKSHIPDFNPYIWDPALADFDRWLHFGRAPWEILAGLSGYGAFTVLIDTVYYLWFPVIFASAAIAAATPGNGMLRHRFLIAFAMSWILIGCFSATLFSSVGPIFYDRLTGGPSVFTPLTALLTEVSQGAPLQALTVRDNLWASYLDPPGTIISGISAMPSMHNALCVLLFLAARHISRWLALAAAVFAGAIFLGSVHLGWHYAVDGYAAAALTAAIWKASGMIVNGRFQPKRARRSASAKASA